MFQLDNKIQTQYKKMTIDGLICKALKYEMMLKLNACQSFTTTTTTTTTTKKPTNPSKKTPLKTSFLLKHFQWAASYFRSHPLFGSGGSSFTKAIIVTGGYSVGTSVEVVSPFGVPLPCTVPPLPAARVAHTQDGMVACGGYGDANCVSLTQ